MVYCCGVRERHECQQAVLVLALGESRLAVQDLEPALKQLFFVHTNRTPHDRKRGTRRHGISEASNIFGWQGPHKNSGSWHKKRKARNGEGKLAGLSFGSQRHRILQDIGSDKNRSVGGVTFNPALGKYRPDKPNNERGGK